MSGCAAPSRYRARGSRPACPTTSVRFPDIRDGIGTGDDAAARAGTDVTAVQSTRDLGELIASSTILLLTAKVRYTGDPAVCTVYRGRDEAEAGLHDDRRPRSGPCAYRSNCLPPMVIFLKAAYLIIQPSN
ncbi:hypothetical protein CFB43_21030 [Burkholderia sp. AU15512]|nr:hypothetical protein CFB43_21030 [Burkholderia sp. AU15512]